MPRAPARLSLLVAALLVTSAALAAPPRAPARAPARWAPPRPNPSAVIKRWHEAPRGVSAPRDEGGRPMLALFALNTGERLELRAQTDDGGFDAEALDRAAAFLRDPRTGLSHPVEPMLLDFVYRAQRHFESAEIRVVSAYRAPRQGGQSNHGRGRAMDLVVAGASDEAVATWARAAGFAGVGIYPKSGFCHLDVRESSHFWVDPSGPGQRSRELPLRGGQPRKSDDDARKRHARPVTPFVLPRADVSAAWTGKPAPPSREAGPHPREEAHDEDEETPSP